MRRKTTRVILAVTAAGIVMLVLSFLLAENTKWQAGWISGTLVEVGGAAVLFAVFYGLTRSLDRHIQDVADKTAESVEGVRAETSALRDRVDDFEGEVTQKLEELAESVRSGVEAESALDLAVFDALKTAPSRAIVVEALNRAKAAGLIDDHQPPRVEISNGHYVYLSVELEPAEVADWVGLVLRLEEIGGETVNLILWPENKTIEQAMIEVGRALRKKTGENLEIAHFFRSLSETLTVADSHPALRPIIQLCPPQWAITTKGIVAYSKPPNWHYSISIGKLNADKNMSAHMHEKSWIHADSYDDASYTASELYRRRSQPPL